MHRSNVDRSRRPEEWRSPVPYLAPQRIGLRYHRLDVMLRLVILLVTAGLAVLTLVVGVVVALGVAWIAVAVPVVVGVGLAAGVVALRRRLWPRPGDPSD